MFGEPMDLILYVSGLGLIVSIPVVTLWWCRDTLDGRQVGFLRIVDTVSLWINRAVVVVAVLLIPVIFIGDTYASWGWWGVGVVGVWLGFALLVLLRAKMRHNQERFTNAADGIDGAPEVDGSRSAE